MKKKSGKGIRISTLVLVFVLVITVLSMGFTYYDLFGKKITPVKTRESSSSEKTAEDPERKISQRVKEGETGTKVMDEASAWDAFDQLKGKYGIRNVRNEYELLFSSKTTTQEVYRFQQQYDGLDVFGYEMKLIVGSDGIVKNMNGPYVNLSGLDTEFTLNEEEAGKEVLSSLAKEYSKSEAEFTLSGGERGIFVPENEDEAQVAYHFYVNGPEKINNVFCSGKDGKILEKGNSVFYEDEDTQLQGQSNRQSLRAFKTQDNRYKLYDSTRNIYVIDDPSLRDVETAETDYMNQIDADDQAILYTENDRVSQSGADALANAERAVDYYKNVLGRESLDEDNHPVLIQINCTWDDRANGLFDTDSLKKDYNYFSFTRSKDGSPDKTAYIDTVGHEFTHCVVTAISDLGNYSPYSQTSEPAAIQEGLADLFGELIEDYDYGNLNEGELNNGIADWDHGNRHISRALSPQKGDTPLVTLASDYVGKNVDCHYGSAIISYPAYLMTDQIDSYTMARLYYDTICNLQPRSNFINFRSQFDYKMVDYNNMGLLTDRQMECAIDSMDMSGIEPLNCNYKVAKGGRLEILDKYNEAYDEYTITIQKQGDSRTIVDHETSSEGAFYTLPDNLNTGYYDVTLEDKNKPNAQAFFVLLVNDNSSQASGRIKDYEKFQEIKTPFNGEAQEIVFVLDRSGSMAGDPLADAKTAANGCIENILTDEPKSRISVIAYSDDAETMVQSSNNLQNLKDTINGLSSSGDTNTYAALESAGNILKDPDKKDAKKRIIVLLSDGMPNQGPEDNGDYNPPIVRLTEELKKEGILFYTIGSFSSMDNDDAVEAEKLMKSISSPGYDYNVEEDEVEDVFYDISKVVNGMTYQSIRVACPVDVEISSGGEVLSSAEDNLNKRTSFGYLSFEGDENDPAKVIRLENDGTDYDICITGTGKGTMDYSISYPDENGQYTDTRTFEKIPVREGTFITTSTRKRMTTSLKVDRDGNGSIDRTYTASRTRKGRTRASYYFRYGLLIFVFLFMTVLIIWGIVVLRRYLKNGVCAYCGRKINPKARFCPACGRPHEYTELFFPKRRGVKKQSTVLFVLKMIVISYCLLSMIILSVIKKTAPVSAYQQIQQHHLGSAIYMYEHGVKGKKNNEKMFRLLMDPYMKRVEKAQKEGDISDAYVEELNEALEKMRGKE